jgi:hypothetical protein
VLGRRPTPTTWETGSQHTCTAGRGNPSSTIRETFSEILPTPSKFDVYGSTSNYPEYGGRASSVPLYMRQPPPTSHHPHPVQQPVVDALPRNSRSQQIPFHWRGDSEATMVEQRDYDHLSRNYSYSSKSSGSTVVPALSRRTVMPERIITPESSQRLITPSSVLVLKMETPRSTSPTQRQRNTSRITNDDRLSWRGSLVPRSRQVASHSPSASIGSRLEPSIKGELSVETQQPSSWRGPNHGTTLSAVLGPQDAPVIPRTPTHPAQRPSYSPKSPPVPGHHRTRSRGGLL